MKISTLAYRPSFKLHLPTIVLMVILLSLLTACGGSSSSSASPTNPTSTVSLTISAASNEVYAGGSAVSLIVSKSQGSGTVSWSLNNTSLGSLSASSGDTIQYTPPSPQSLGGATSVTITASIGSVSQSLILPIRSTARLEFVAGTLGGPGNIDDVGMKARFYQPQCVVVDKDGTVFVCDTGSGAIRKITSAGLVSSLATIEAPRALTIDRDGKVYVIDGKNNLIRSISPQGVVSTLSTQITLKANSELKDIAVDVLGNLYVLENEAIHRITQAGVVSVFAGKSGSVGATNAKGENARFTSLESIVIDKENNLYLLDDIVVRKITPDADVTTIDVWEKNYFAGITTKGAGIALDPAGNLLVTRFEPNAKQINGLSLRRINKSGGADLLEIQGEPLASGIAKIAIGGNGKIYLADSKNDRILSMMVQGNSAQIAQFAGKASSLYRLIEPNPNSLYLPMVTPMDAAGANAQFYYPPQLTVSNGELLSYEAPWFVTRDKLFRRISQSGSVSNLPAVRGISLDYLDRPPMRGFVADTQGNLYFGSRREIFRFSTSGLTTSLIDQIEFKFGDVIDLGIDQQDRLYFATLNAVYRLNSESGAVLIAGQSKTNEYKDGNGAAARFGAINGLHVARDGSIYVTDKNVLRKIDARGNVTTIAGKYGESGTIDGTGSAARLDAPKSITSDAAGNIYLADSALSGDSRYAFDFNMGKNHTIRKISPTGIVSTIAGVAGKFGVGLDSSPNTLGFINDIQFVAPNTLYVSSEYSVLKINLTN
nr:hypothetical protein [uncultured Undibacterium sp.]